MDNSTNTHIHLRKEGNGIFFAKEPVVRLSKDDIQFLKEEAVLNRKSSRLCMHRNMTDDVHEMFILHLKENYVRPHKHPGKSVSYHIIEGIADMVLFNEQGE